MDETSISKTLVPDDLKESWRLPCRNEECWAIRDIVCAADAYAAQLIPNTMGYHSPAEAQRDYDRYGRNIEALGQEHPGRISLYCKLLARVAATIPGETADAVEKGARDRTAFNVTDMAIHLDRPGNGCLAGVVAAVPRTENAMRSMEYARSCLRHVQLCQMGHAISSR